MRLFKALVERNELERKWLPMIHAELQKLNAAIAQQTHEQSASGHTVHSELRELAANTNEFIEVIRGFFAIERERRDADMKRKIAENEELKPAKHDNIF